MRKAGLGNREENRARLAYISRPPGVVATATVARLFTRVTTMRKGRRGPSLREKRAVRDTAGIIPDGNKHQSDLNKPN